MNAARMLGKAGVRRILITGRFARRCACPECVVRPTRRVQRAREKRAWQREAARC